LDLYMGTRHRAAIGISQETDAIVVLVSEERACVNLVVGGRVSNKLDANELRAQLSSFFVSDAAKRNDEGSQKPVLSRTFEKTAHIIKSKFNK